MKVQLTSSNKSLNHSSVTFEQTPEEGKDPVKPGVVFTISGSELGEFDNLEVGKHYNITIKAEK